MSDQPQLFRLTSVFAALLLVLSGCGGDSKNTSDNTPGGATQGVGAGPGTITPVTLTKAGAPLEIDDEDLGDVAGHTAVVDSSGNVTVVWTQDDGMWINLWSNRYFGGNWGTAVKIEVEPGNVGPAKLVVDSSGNVMAVWVQDTAVVDGADSGVRTDLYSAYYTAGGGWGERKLIDQHDLSNAATILAEDIGSFEVVIDSNDVITAVWSQHDGTRKNMHADRASGGAWGGTPTKLNSYASSVDAPTLVLDSSNNLFVAWIQGGSNSVRDFWVARYDDSSSLWGLASNLSNEVLNKSVVEGVPQLVTDTAGNAIAVWVQSRIGPKDLWANHYDEATDTWNGDINIEAENLGDAGVAQLVAVGVDDFHVVWNQYNGTVNNLWANRYFGGVWAGEEEIEADDTGSASSANLVVDSSGNITAVWVQGDGAVNSLWSNRYSAGVWGTADTIETTDDGDVTSASVLIDGSDRVTAVWLQANNGRFDLWSNRASAAGVWGTAELVETLDNGSAADPRLILDALTEDITVVWREPVTYDNQLLTSKYDVSSSAWTTVTQVEPSGNDSGLDVKLVVDSSGTVTVLWLHQDTSGLTSRFDLWANRI